MNRKSLGALVTLNIVLLLALILVTGGNDSTANDGVKRAVIVDQLSLTQPNPEFISDARGTLAAAGYTVEYIPGEDVTVDIYRSLPDRDYDLVLLRVHAGITTEVNEATGDMKDHYPGWVAWLYCLKGAADHGITLKNRSPSKTWQKGYVDG